MLYKIKATGEITRNLMQLYTDGECVLYSRLENPKQTYTEDDVEIVIDTDIIDETKLINFINFLSAEGIIRLK